ncbi:hypothetical protein [Neptunicella marina]|uniref:Uncharacterized protein n=1 Tax=Neptunicella marina TaxID=2125989 RepID=A0A8J6ISF2_9ALTE|nr:hypothetical protein [Neptunicella marina]MBC3765434.1 hypothetical protein [Neptunicella marina]
MSSTDNIIMAVGGLLILIGLYLFIGGKKDSGSHNNVEGFGIKLNVSNPSIILIIVGVGLLLVPRLLPESKPTPIDSNERVIDNNPDPKVSPSPQIEPQKPDADLFFPAGFWQLANYKQNGIEMPVPSMVRGNISFGNPANQQISWKTHVWIDDIWGGTSNFFYQGQIRYNNGGYFISFDNSNDPDFSPNGFVPLELYMENEQLLHMAYTSQGLNDLLHWHR